MEIKLDGKNSEKEKDRKGRPRTHSDPSCYEEENPKSKEDEEGNPSSRKKRKLEMAKIDTKGIDDEDRNERKAKGATHLRLGRINFSGC